MKRRPKVTIKRQLRSYISSFLPVKNPKKFVIYGQGRTGSTLLTDLLDSHPEIACSSELLARKVWFPYRYLKGIGAEHHRYVFGFKVKIYQLTNNQELDPEDFLNRLEERGYQIIYLRRNNFLEHAISGVIRLRRQNAHLLRTEKYQEESFNVPVEKLDKKMRKRKDHQERELKTLEGRKYFEVIYETHLKDSKDHQNTCNAIFNYLGLNPAKIDTKYQKINKKMPKDILLNYDELSVYFKNTPFEKFFR